MLIINRLPHFVYLNNEKFYINTSFKKMVILEMMMQDKKLTKEDKIIKGLKLLYPAFFKIMNSNDPQLYIEACDKLLWFYKCGRDYDESSKKGKDSKKQIYSYEYDDEYIYSAFIECYGIDINEIDMHWWKFRALLKGLSSDCEFVKIKGYRAYDGDDKNIKELKSYYAIPLSNEEKERLKKLSEMLK